MKYFLATICEMINGFETYSKQIIVARNYGSALKKGDKICKYWRGKASWSDTTGYYFDGGGIRVNFHITHEVNKEEAKTLLKYL